MCFIHHSNVYKEMPLMFIQQECDFGFVLSAVSLASNLVTSEVQLLVDP